MADTTIEHPNTMDFVAYNGNNELGNVRIYSIGGGSIKIKGETNQDDITTKTYPESFTTQILKVCRKNKQTLFQYVKTHEQQTF
jgi:L-serine dehydratase